jgi:CO dehydrogenase maturation factor
MLTVVEPYFKSLETGRRMAALADDLGLERVALVANKVRDERDLEAVRQFADRHDLELAGVVPFDPSFQGAERAEQAPLDFAPEAPGVQAIDAIARAWGGDGRA